jgi:hypothetical protein
VVIAGDMTVCQRCGGVFTHGRCFQCGWSGEPISDAARREQGGALGMFELHKMEQRLARKATALGVSAGLEGPVADAVEHAFTEAHDAPPEEVTWITRFELMATEYLEGVARNQSNERSHPTTAAVSQSLAAATLPFPTERGNG